MIFCIFDSSNPQILRNPQALVAQKIEDEVVSRRFQGEGVEFFLKSDLTDPPQIFDAHFSSPSRFHFSVGFISRSCFESEGFITYSNEWDWRDKKTMFIYTNQPLIRSFYIKKVPIFCRMTHSEWAMSQRWSAIFCATGAWGLRNDRSKAVSSEINLLTNF